jgi:hypothetical protein
MLNRPSYDPNQAVVAVGPMAWKGALFGLKEGIEGERETAAEAKDEKIVKDLKNDGISKFNRGPLRGIKQLPTLAFIPAKELTGWSLVPRRMLYWFYQRDDANAVADATMAMILESKRAYTDSDFENGSDDFVKTVFEPETGDDEREKVLAVEEFGGMGELGQYLTVYAAESNPTVTAE